jgi:tetratricopeptide (TPR) repeat protein
MSRKQVLLLVATAVLLASTAWFTWDYYGPDRSYEEAYDRTTELALQGRDAACVKVWRQYTRRHPEDPAGHTYLASALIRRDHYDAAEQAIARALELDPSLPQAYLWRATLLEARAEYAAADRDLERGLELIAEEADAGADDAEATATRVLLLAAGEDWEAAGNAVERALETHPDHTILQLTRIRVLTAQNAFEEAIEHCDRLLAERPQGAYLFMIRGAVRDYAGEPQAAMEDLTRAIEINPTYHQALLRRAWLALDEGEIDLALEDSERALEANEGSGWGWFVRGSALVEAMRWENMPEWAQSPVLAWIYYYRQRQQARHHLERAIEIDPHAAAAHVAVAETHTWSGDYNEARPHARRAVDLYTAKIEAREPATIDYLWRASAYMTLRDYKNARSDLQQALDVAESSTEQENAQRWLEYLDEVDPSGATAGSGGAPPQPAPPQGSDEEPQEEPEGKGRR